MNSRKFENLSNVTGKNIQKYRKLNGWSRVMLSNKLMLLGIDINYDSIYKIENNRRIVKDFELAAFAKVFNITATELLEDFNKKLDKWQQGLSLLSKVDKYQFIHF